jgi:broad specificity phosphatase PhoE
MAVALAWFFEQQATTTVIFVRYAEREAGLGDDDSLSEAGRRRAEDLRRMLAEVDIVRGPDAIYVSSYPPTLETAAPVARARNVPIEEFDPDNIARLARRVLKKYKGKVVLVVADPASIRAAIPEFQGSKRISPDSDAEADNLYVVTIPWYGKVKTLRLRYGAPTASEVPAGPVAVPGVLEPAPGPPPP